MVHNRQTDGSQIDLTKQVLGRTTREVSQGSGSFDPCRSRPYDNYCNVWQLLVAIQFVLLKKPNHLRSKLLRIVQRVERICKLGRSRHAKVVGLRS